MYTKEELKGRVFCSDRERWIEAAAKDYRSKEEAKVQAIKNGIMLPLRKIPGTNSFAGGVCDARFKFVAGLRRNLECPSWSSCEESYKVNGGVKRIDEAVIFGGVLIGHFGHAILECLSRLWFVAENSPTERIAFLPTGKAEGGAFTSFYDGLFALLDVDPKRIIYIEEPTQFERVIVPDETVHVEGACAQYKEKYASVYAKMMSGVEAKEAILAHLNRCLLCPAADSRVTCNSRRVLSHDLTSC